MKKYLEIAVGVMAAVVSVSAAAQTSGTSCTAGVAGPGATVAGTSANFVQVTFVPRCSNNVHLAYSQNTVAFAVGAASSKGKNSFLGNTVGGGVSSFTSCAATGCSAANATGAATEAYNKANSS